MTDRIEAVLLAPGAGSDRDQATLVALEAALDPLPVVRMDFPYRKAGKKFPDRAPALIASVASEVAAMCEALDLAETNILLGGRSMGGRMCSMYLAEQHRAGTTVPAGLALVSYPLHPPGKPDKLRTEHLPDVHVPALFISGTKDPFGTPGEFAAALDLVSGETTMIGVSAKRHDLAGCDSLVCETVVEWIKATFPATEL